MSKRSGQCLCGAVRYQADEVSSEFGVCHCRMCQRWSGGPFAATTAQGLNFDNEEHLRRFQSSAWAERGFCAQCGSNIYYRVTSSDAYEVCVGTLDVVDDIVMTSEIFIDRKPPGYALAGEHPRLTEAETLEKYKEFSS